MMKRLIALTSFGAGYVLGARAGRERYEQIRSLTMRVKNDPRVQAKAHQAAEVAREQAPVVKDKVQSAAETVKDKVTHDDGAGKHTTTTTQYTPYQGAGATP
jgi:hypothetical protein